MIKFKQGYITSHLTGKTKDIMVKSATPNTLRDALIGGTMVLIGITYLTVTAFKNGAEKFDNAQMKALSDLGLLEDCDF